MQATVHVTLFRTLILSSIYFSIVLMPKYRPKSRHLLNVLLLLMLALHACFTLAFEQQKQFKPLRIAVSANFAPALKILLEDLPNKEHINLQIISAATGTLYQQIKHGAPFDLFLSADAARPKLLEQEALIIEKSRKTYAYGQIALWSATQKLTSLDVLNDYTGNLAMANPDIAPYGKAAKQALEYLSLWSQAKFQLITGININQTFQQVRSQAVPLGIVAYSQLKMNQYQGLLIPAAYYQGISQQAVIIKSSQQVELAQQITDFILQASSQDKLQELGYLAANSLQAIRNPETSHD